MDFKFDVVSRDLLSGLLEVMVSQDTVSIAIALKQIFTIHFFRIIFLLPVFLFREVS